MTDNNIPPTNIEAEEAILGSILFDPSAISIAAPILPTEAFYVAGNRAQTVGKFSGAFKDIAKEFDVPFVALAQINRGVESQANKRPLMSDLKDSGDIEQDMDLGLLLYRDDYYNSDADDPGVMEIIVGKNRNGSTGTCRVDFDPSIGKFN